LAKPRPRIIESGTTSLSPSVEQKRLIANGRSAEMTSTTAFGNAAAFSLNFRAEIAQTRVSRLGTMLRTFVFPRYESRVTSLSSPVTRRKSGAVDPTAGSSPFVWQAMPSSTMSAI